MKEDNLETATGLDIINWLDELKNNQNVGWIQNVGMYESGDLVIIRLDVSVDNTDKVNWSVEKAFMTEGAAAFMDYAEEIIKEYDRINFNTK